MDKDFTAIARQQLLDEQNAAFERRVKERANRLAEEHRQQTSTDFPTDPGELRQRLAVLQARESVLKAKPQWARAAADDHELDALAQRIHEMQKRLRQLDRLAAA